MWLQCKRQVPSAVTCHTKLFPDKFRIKLQSLAAFTWPVPSHPLCQERARVEGNWEKPLKEIVPVLPLLTFHGTLKRRVGRSLNFYLKIENVINDLSLCGQILHPPPPFSPGLNGVKTYLPFIPVPEHFHKNFILIKEMHRVFCGNDLDIWLE